MLVRESNGQSKELFALLEGSGTPNQTVDAQNKVNGFRVQSASIVDRARDLDVPDQASQAQRYLLETLEFRRDGLAKIAEDLPNALGDESRRAGLRGRGAPDAGLPRERRDLRGPLHARASRRC